jgi:precorrin isomerase
MDYRIIASGINDARKNKKTKNVHAYIERERSVSFENKMKKAYSVQSCDLEGAVKKKCAKTELKRE